MENPDPSNGAASPHIPTAQDAAPESIAELATIQPAIIPAAESPSTPTEPLAAPPTAPAIVQLPTGTLPRTSLAPPPVTVSAPPANGVPDFVPHSDKVTHVDSYQGPRSPGGRKLLASGDNESSASLDEHGKKNIIVEKRDMRRRELWVKYIFPALFLSVGWLLAAGFLAGMIYEVSLDRSDYYQPVTQNLSEWTYIGLTSPTYWGNLSKSYKLCDKGMLQSPISLSRGTTNNFVANPVDDDKVGHLGNILFMNNVSNVTVSWENNSPFYKCQNGPCGEVRWMSNDTSATFDITQFVFRTRSEHPINRVFYLMEMQLMSFTKIDEFNGTIVSVLFQSSTSPNVSYNLATPTLMSLFDIINSTSETVAQVNWTTLITGLDRGYFAYNGSITYPPCDQGYRWIVSTALTPVYPDVAQRYLNILPYPGNFRNIQSANDRFLYDYGNLTSEIENEIFGRSDSVKAPEYVYISKDSAGSRRIKEEL